MTVEDACPSSWLKRLQAIFCLLPLLVGQTGVLPAFLAIATDLEGSHTIYVATGASGFTLRLTHERGQAGRPDFLLHHQPASPAHHHGLATKTLCIVGGRLQGLADHEAAFSKGGAAERAASQVRLLSHLAAENFIAASQISSVVSIDRPAAQFSPAVCGLPQAVQELRTILLLV